MYNRLNTSQNSPRFKLRFCSYPTDPERFSLSCFILWSVFVPTAIRDMCVLFYNNALKKHFSKYEILNSIGELSTITPHFVTGMRWILSQSSLGTAEA